LLYLQGVKIPDPPELKQIYPDKNPVELIEIQREIYGCKFDWKMGSIIVVYKDAQFDVSLEAKEIVANTTSDKLVDLLGFDDKGFDFNTACNTAIKKIIDNITNGDKKPL